MTGYNNNIQAYKNAFASVDKLNQVIMLYDAAITSLQQARQAVIDKNIEERFNKISKAFHIITGLQHALDHTKGGEVASILSDWYSGTSLRILNFSRTQDLSHCDLTISHIKQMRDAWVEVEKQMKEGNVSGSADSSNISSASSTSSTGSLEAFANNNNDFFSAAIKKAAYSTGFTASTVIKV